MAYRLHVESGWDYSPSAKPDMRVHQPGDIDPVLLLKEKGIRGWILDLDGTFVPQLRDEHPMDPKDVAFLDAIEASSESVAFVGTNRDSGWLGSSFTNEHPLSRLDFYYGDDYKKPDPRYYHPILQRFKNEYGIDTAQIAMVGDTPLDDILGANKIGLFAIQVARLHESDYPTSSVAGWQTDW